jgi:hypothetical protein
VPLIGYPYPKGNTYHGFSGGDNIMQDNTFAALKIKKDDRKLYESLKLDRASLLRGSNSLMATPMSTS